MGPVRTWLPWVAVLGRWPRGMAGVGGQLQSRRWVQLAWHSTPGLPLGLALWGAANGCLLASAEGFRWGLLPVPR